MRYVMIFFLCANIVLAQQSKKAYEIPFPEGTSASKGNVIELSVANHSALTAEGVKVESDKCSPGYKVR